MKRFIATSVAASLLVGSLAFADPVRLTFDDTAFDYAPRTSSAPAYLVLDRQGNALQVRFTEIAEGATLPAVIVEEVAELEGEDFFGNDRLATIENLDEIELVTVGSSVRGFKVLHEGTTLGDAVASYKDTLEGLGFESAQVTLDSANIATFTFQDDDAQLRARFRRVGGAVEVVIRAI